MQGIASRVRRRRAPRALPAPGGWLVDLPSRLLLAASVLFLLLAFILGYRLAYLGRIHPGIRALGVDLGGMSPAEAGLTLQRRFVEYSDRSVPLHYQRWTWTPTPAQLGLRLDLDAVVSAAYFATRPAHPLARVKDEILVALRGRTLSDVGLRIDPIREAAFLDQLAGQIDRPAVEARLALSPDLKVEISPSQAGRRLDRDKTRQLLARGLLALESGAGDLPVEDLPPAVVESDLQAEKALAERIIASPLVVRFEDRQWSLSRPEIAPLLVFRSARPGARAGAVVTLADERLEEVVARLAQEVDRPAQNARFAWGGGSPQVIRPSQDGHQVDTGAAIQALRDKLLGTDRTLTLPGRKVAPQITEADRRLFAMAELIEAASTDYSGGVAERRHNVELAASRLHGVVVAPGQTFSFNNEVGPTTLKAGFQVGWGITSAGQQVETVPSVAGGICQVATNLFQAAFWAGYQIEERNYHLYWIPRYDQKPLGMKGLDATVDAPSVDLKFTNTTPYPLLIQSHTDGTRLTFSLYGVRPQWTVKVEGPLIENVVPADPTEVRQEDPTMPAGKEIQIEGAQDGFTATIVRTVTEGDDVRSLKLVSRYRPSRNVILVGTGP